MSAWRRIAARREAWYAGALLLQLALAPWLIHDWDGHVFLRTAEDLLAGLSPYEVAEQAPFHVFLDDRWPPVNAWYAYPPLAMLLFAPAVGLAKLVSSDPLLLRAAVKLPFILGHLLLAYAAGRLVARVATDDPEGRRRRAERMLLFNPFLLFIAAAWGMFDGLVVAFLLLSALLLESRRPAWAGAAFALAGLAKVFPVLVAPFFLACALLRGGWRCLGRFAGAAALVALAACAPFLLASPAGFWQQVVGMHAERGAQGFALVSFPLQLRHVNNLFAWEIPIAPEPVVLAVGGALLLLAWGLLLPRALEARGARDLVQASLLVFLAFLLLNKVVNEQYLVLPVALLAVLAALDDGRARRALRAFTWGGLASSILIGLHFVTFVPADLARRWGLPRPDDVVAGVAARLDLPVLVVFSVPHVLAILALVPAMVWAVRLVAPALLDGVRRARGVASRALSRLAPRRAALAAHLAVALLLLAPPVAGAILAAPDPAAPPPPLPERLVLARYDLAIGNPSHDPAVRDGAWLDPSLPMPRDGWYAATTRKVQLDLAALRDAGVDAVVVAHSAGNRLRLETFLEAAAEAGLRAAPSLDLGRLEHCPDAQRLPPSALAAPPPRLLDDCLEGATRPFEAHPHALRADGRLVVLLRNATAAQLEPRRDGRLFLVAGVGDGPAPDWADAAWREPSAARSAEEHAAAQRALADERPWAARVAAAFPSTWAVRGASAETYARTWDAALALDADWVVVPWNVHREGGAVEPLAGGGPDLLAATRERAAALRAAPALQTL